MVVVELSKALADTVECEVTTPACADKTDDCATLPDPVVITANAAATAPLAAMLMAVNVELAKSAALEATTPTGTDRNAVEVTEVSVPNPDDIPIIEEASSATLAPAVTVGIDSALRAPSAARCATLATKAVVADTANATRALVVCVVISAVVEKHATADETVVV